MTRLLQTKLDIALKMAEHVKQLAGEIHDSHGTDIAEEAYLFASDTLLGLQGLAKEIEERSLQSSIRVVEQFGPYQVVRAL
jgi:hypothetical protein